MSYYDDDWEPSSGKLGTKQKRLLGKYDPHIPNKFERKKLAQIAQKAGGATIEEIRSQYGNNVALSKAAKSNYGNGSVNYKLRLRNERNSVAFELGTHINDPRVMGIAKGRLRQKSQRLSRWF